MIWTAKPEVLQAMDEPVNVPALTEFVEVIGTEVFIEGSALQHFIDGSEDRSGDGANGLFGAAAGAQAMELSLEVTGLFAGGGRGALDKGGFEPGCAPAFARAGFCASGWSAACRHSRRCAGTGRPRRSGARRLESGAYRGRFRQG